MVGTSVANIRMLAASMAAMLADSIGDVKYANMAKDREFREKILKLLVGRSVKLVGEENP
jgi:hypothetical protein